MGRNPRPGKPSLLLGFAAFVKQTRNERGFTQLELADAATAEIGKRVTQSKIAQLESGKIADPKPQLLRALASVLGYTYPEIVARLVADKFEFSLSQARFLVGAPLHPADIGWWITELPERSTLWFVAPQLLHWKYHDLVVSFAHLMENGGTAVLCVVPSQLGAGQDLDILALRLKQTATACSEQGIRVVVDETGFARLEPGFIIANPFGLNNDWKGADGFLIMHDSPDGDLLGFRMPGAAIARQVAQSAPVMTQGRTLS